MKAPTKRVEIQEAVRDYWIKYLKPPFRVELVESIARRLFDPPTGDATQSDCYQAIDEEIDALASHLESRSAQEREVRS